MRSQKLGEDIQPGLKERNFTTSSNLAGSRTTNRATGSTNASSPQRLTTSSASRNRATASTGSSSRSRIRSESNATKEGALMNYDLLIKQAHRIYGWSGPGSVHRSTGKGHESLPIEWERHLLQFIEAPEDEQVIIFSPVFLRRSATPNPVDEFQLALKYLLLQMDRTAMRAQGKFSFVLCNAGLDWITPEMIAQCRQVGDMLPKKYSKNLKRFYILHPTKLMRASLWTLWSWMSGKMWEKIEYVNDVDLLGALLFGSDEEKHAELRQCLPLIVQRADATATEKPPPVVFGASIKQLRKNHGIDVVCRSSGRMYEQLPVPLVTLIEALDNDEELDVDVGFLEIFNVEGEVVQNLLTTIDEGRPIERSVPAPALWCALKVFLDCLPLPLLTFKALDDLINKRIHIDDSEGQRQLLTDLLVKQLAFEKAQSPLFLAAFLARRCEASLRKRADDDAWTLTPWQVAQMLAPAFLRPRDMNAQYIEWIPVVNSLVETLILTSDSSELWTGRIRESQIFVAEGVSDVGESFSIVDSESESEEEERTASRSIPATSLPIPSASRGKARADSRHGVQLDDTPESTRTPSLS